MVPFSISPFSAVNHIASSGRHLVCIFEKYFNQHNNIHAKPDFLNQKCVWGVGGCLRNKVLHWKRNQKKFTLNKRRMRVDQSQIDKSISSLTEKDWWESSVEPAGEIHENKSRRQLVRHSKLRISFALIYCQTKATKKVRVLTPPIFYFFWGGGGHFIIKSVRHFGVTVVLRWVG